MPARLASAKRERKAAGEGKTFGSLETVNARAADVQRAKNPFFKLNLFALRNAKDSPLRILLYIP